MSQAAGFNPCDLNQDGVVNSADVNLAVNMALGTNACTANVEGADTCTVVTVQRVVNASLGQACVVYNAPVISSATSASATVGNSFSYQITASNSPSSYGAAGLPGGLSINTASGLISGTPSAAGSFSVVLTATNSVWSGTANLALTITGTSSPTITSGGSAAGMVGSSFSYQITATNSPTSYGATGLPGGLSINSSTGLISGTPAAAGTSNVTLSATNASGTGTLALKLTIVAAGPAPVITSSSSASSTVGTAFSYQITASNSPTSYGATGLPSGLSINSTTGLISGTPTGGGTSTVTLTATNTSGTGTFALTLTVTHSVVLSWTASTSSNVAGYNIYRGTVSGGPYSTSPINSTLVTGTSYTDTSVVAGQTYYYVAIAVDSSSNQSGDSNQATAAIPSP